MVKATKRILTVAAVIAAAGAPSAAHAGVALNPSPRGVAIPLAQVQGATAVMRLNRDERCPRVGPCISPYSVVTRGPGHHAVHQTAEASQQPFQWDAAGLAAGMLLLITGGSTAAIVTRRRHNSTTAS